MKELNVKLRVSLTELMVVKQIPFFHETISQDTQLRLLSLTLALKMYA